MEEEIPYTPTLEEEGSLMEVPYGSQFQELAASLHAAQSEMSNPKKDANNPFFDSQYLSLAQLLTTVREVLNKHGLVLIQEPVTRQSGVGCVTILMHRNGARMAFGPLLLPCKNDPQAYGAAVSYARRYALQSVLGLAGEDDDANSAVPDRPPAKKIHEPSPASTVDMGLEREVKVLSIGRKSDRHPFILDTDRGEFSTYDKNIMEEAEFARTTGSRLREFKWKKNAQWGNRMIISEPKKEEGGG
jgi:hypothetical protein